MTNQKLTMAQFLSIHKSRFTHTPKEATMNFALRKTTITSVQALLDKCPDPFLLEVVLEGPEGEIDMDTPVWVLPDVDFSEYNGQHCQWLMEAATHLNGEDGYNGVYPYEEEAEELLYDGQEIYVITKS